MNTEWPTQDQDLRAATEIIDRHIDLNGGEPLNLEQVVADQEAMRDHHLHAPDWVVDLTNHFIGEYGMTEGRVITERVLTKFLLGEQTIH